MILRITPVAVINGERVSYLGNTNPKNFFDLDYWKVPMEGTPFGITINDPFKKN